jgi:hypothetical protein
MLKQLVHATGVPAPEKIKSRQQKTDRRRCRKVDAIAYGDLTPAEQICAADAGAGDPFKVGRESDRSRRSEIRC